ncbi:tetratricopeptide repeat protein [uncultured Desulfosarcina sp.]|uniref:tetratricopeptide repeat protein n=1 Tax=uncultured Desulfosarcina sp. TaxID=218289 RepID=UPI0029C694E8|nr:tetratricopeptide repeat protein [uncultured Desulfosarcina sp.]
MTASGESQVNRLLEKGQRLEAGADFQSAVDLYQQALAISPDDARVLGRLGAIAYRAGQLSRAETFYLRAADREPGYWAHHKGLGNVYKRQGRLAEAESSLRQAIALSPESAEVHYDLGIVHQIGGRLEKALAGYRSAIDCDPEHAPAWNNLGLVYLDLGERDKAIDCLQTAIAKKPDFAGAYNNLGNLLNQDNDLNGAADCYERSLTIDPKQASIFNVLGSTYQLKREQQKAMACYRQAIRLNPEIAEYWVNWGTAFQDADNLKQAIECYRKALGIEPSLSQAHLNLGLAYNELGRKTEARQLFEKAVELDPNYGNALNHLVTLLIGECAWEEAEKYGKILDRQTRNMLDRSEKPAENPFLNIIRHSNPGLNLEVARAWSREIEMISGNRIPKFSFESGSFQDRRLNIGYLSGNIRNHPTADLTLGLFERHDRERFNVFCYAYGKDDDGYQRRAIREASDRFREISAMDDLSAATMIHKDRIDILIDFMGFTKGARLGICAFRPAPIQVRMLGMAGTTGASFFDYLIGDRIVTPRSHQKHYTEQLVLMPYSYQINNYSSEADFSGKDIEARPNGCSRFVFASFCTAYKIEKKVFQAWMNILNRVPESDLWLMPESAAVKKKLCISAERLGVNPQRLVFLEKLEKKEHLERLAKVDLALDTRTVNGAATTSDALWMGVPVLTIQGRHFASRMSSSLLHAMNLTDLVKNSLGEYVDGAVYLATHPERLREIRSSILKNRYASRLFDTDYAVGCLETAYQRMWSCRLADGTPKPIELNDVETV